MFTQLALILTLVLQQLTLPAILANWMPAHCQATSCCQTVERTTCCGEQIVEIQCAMTGGECLCGLEPEQSDTPTPALPTLNSTQLVFSLPLCGMIATIEWSNTARVTATHTWGRPFRSRNSQQALLGVWRT